jgi:capsule polysaccharide export protein KpsE/RkpR
MSHATNAQTRQLDTDLSETEFPEAPISSRSPRSESRLVPRLRLLWDNRSSLFRVALYSLVASTVVAFLIPNKYESTTRLMPPDNQSASSIATAVAAISGGLSGALSGLGGISGDLLGLKSTSDIFVGILSSRTVQDKLIQQFNLKKVYSVRRMVDARKALTNHTDISVDRKSQIISITVTDRDPIRAQAMGQAYVEELNHLVAELSTSSARRERIFLEARLQTVNKDLESAEKDFSQFASKNTTIDIKEQGKAMVEAAAALQGHLIAAESELEGLRQIYTDNNVRVRSLRARIEELNRELEKVGGKGEDLSTPEGQQQDSLYPSIRKLPLLGVDYADLYRRTRVQEVVFETLTKEYELAKIQEVKEIPVVKVLDSPNVPDKKSFPPRLIIMILGTTLALAGAVTWIFGKVAWDQTNSDDARKLFAQEVFTTFRASIQKFGRDGSRSNGSGNHSGKERSVNWIPRDGNQHGAP